MPFTKRQIDRILDVGGSPLIKPGRMNHNLAARVTESWTRRRLFAWEDQTVMSMHQQYRDAFKDMRQAALDVADGIGLDKLGRDADSIRFNRQVQPVLERQARALIDSVARESFDAAVVSYYASYYGRAWLMNESTTDAAPLTVEPLPTVDVAEKVLLPQLQEQINPARGFDLLYDLLGVEWRQMYGNELDTLLVSMRRALNASLAEGDSIPAAMRRLREVLGVSTDRRQGYSANFNRVQTITRSYIIEASNAGAIDLYNQNADVLEGMEWLTQFDGRQCAQCEGLDGQVWPIGTPPMRPVSDTHPNCRCSLIPVVRSAWLVPPTQPPRNTFEDFIAQFAVGALLNQFLGGRRIQTDRVGRRA